jgi:hypothetical protein
MDPEKLLTKIDEDGFSWTKDGPTLYKLIDALNSIMPPEWPESFREKSIADYLCKEAAKRKWSAGPWQTPAMRDFLLRALVTLRVS